MKCWGRPNRRKAPSRRKAPNRRKAQWRRFEGADFVHVGDTLASIFGLNGLAVSREWLKTGENSGISGARLERHDDRCGPF